MIQTLLSLFGILIVYRNLSLLEKLQVIVSKKIEFYFLVLQTPLFLFIFFKEQLLFSTIYIGIFLITLIFYRLILKKIAFISYEKRHLQCLDQLILLLSAGKSSQVACKYVFSQLSNWEKLIFSSMGSIFEIQNNKNTKSEDQKNDLQVNPFYFAELKLILHSNHHVIDQLKAFREGLKIRHNLRRKSRQVTQQIKAQALVAIFIFFTMSLISFNYLNLRNSIETFFISLLLFLIGLILIFFVGGQIKWKT